MRLPDRDERVMWLVWVGFGVHLVQAASPLRLDNDSTIYLSLASAVADGGQLTTQHYPLGYPTLVALLDRIGLASSAAIVLLNCLCLAIGLIALCAILRRENLAEFQLWACALTLFSFQMIKSASMAQPDMAYLGASLPALWLMGQSLSADGVKRAIYLVAAAVLTVGALWIRSAGAALLPALVMAVVAGPRGPESRPWWKSGRGVVALGLLVVGCVLAAVSQRAAITAYLDEFVNSYPPGLYIVAQRFVARMKDWAQLSFNVPFSRFRQYELVFLLAGMVSAGFALRRIAAPRSVTPARLYVATYLLILVIWPFETPRLWIPILPFLLALMARAVLTTRGRNGVIPRFFLGWYFVMGIVGMAYTTRVSFAGPDFPRIYAGGNYRNIYDAAKGGFEPTPGSVRTAAVQEGSNRAISPDSAARMAVRVLRRYMYGERH